MSDEPAIRKRRKREPALASYLRDCAALKRDIDVALEDLDPNDNSASRRQIEYAVDFAEMYAFTHPDETKHEIRWFAQDDDYQQLYGINEHVLRNVFFADK